MHHNNWPVGDVAGHVDLSDGVDGLQLKELDKVVEQGEDDDGNDVAETLVHASLQRMNYKSRFQNIKEFCESQK